MLGIPEEHFKGIENKLMVELDIINYLLFTEKNYQNIEKYINRIIHSNQVRFNPQHKVGLTVEDKLM